MLNKVVHKYNYYPQSSTSYINQQYKTQMIREGLILEWRPLRMLNKLASYPRVRLR
jgi:hypothetical protein